MDPYKVLGVSPSATEDEIKEAYRKLVKKYHPDRYQDSALKAQAEEKMKEINAAYEQLTKKQSGSSGSYSGSSGSYSGSYGQSGTYGQSGWGGFGGFGGFGGWGQGAYGQGTYGQSSYGQSGTREYAAEFNKVRSSLNSGDVSGALSALNRIPVRNAEWYFLYGMCCYRNGQYSRAYEYVSRACAMDPSNAEYRSAMSSMRGASDSSRTWTSRGSSMNYCGLCSSLICANLLCNCCCRVRN